MARSNNCLRLFICLVVLCAPLWCAEGPFWCPAEGVIYGVSLKRAADHIVHVDVVTHGPSAEFQLPVWNALYMVRDFAQYVSRATAVGGVPAWMCDRCDVTDAHTTLLDKTTWRVQAEGEHPCITFSYDIFADESGPFGAQLNSQHAFFNWAEVLAYRVGQREMPVKVRLLDVPKGWHLRDAGVFGGRAADQMDGAIADASSYDRLVDAPIEIGRFAEAQVEQGGATYHVAVYADRADYDMNAIRDMLAKVTAAGIDWMQDRPFDDYTFIYHFPRGPGSGGMEHLNGAAVEVNVDRMQRDPLALATLSAHEFFHLWNVKRIRPQSLEPVDFTREQYSRALWFSEGVTSTVAEHLLVRAGLLDEKYFLARLADQIETLNARSARQFESLEDSSLQTWFDKYSYYQGPQRSISYYNKGAVVGVLLDLEMRRATNGHRSLRDLFQYMNARWAQRNQFFNDSESVRLAAEVLTGADFKDFFRRYVSGTDDISYDDFFRSVGLRLVRRQGTVLSPGFAIGRARGGAATIVRVDDGSEADRQGISQGDLLLEIDGKPVTADLNTSLQRHRSGDMVSFKVNSEGLERTFILPLNSQRSDDYSIEDIAGITREQLQLRSAWIRGEDVTGAVQ